jgi:hypothetical protein
MSEHIDTLPIRMIDAIDALPVPAGPGGLRPRARLILRPRLDPVTVLVVIVLALAAVAATPVGRAAVSEAGRLIERLFGLGPWPAYYGVKVTDVSGAEFEGLMFWDGISPGRSVLTTALSPGWGGGWWSPDGSVIAVSAGSSIYLGDRSGVLREVANVTPLQVAAPNWIGPDRVAALARLDDTDWLIYVDVRRGDVSRRLLPDAARPARDFGLRGRFSAGVVPPARKISPDGRWLITGDRPCRSVAVYDLESDRRIELADGVETRGVPLGWLRGSVRVWATCDASTGTLHIRAGTPDAAPTEIGSVPLGALNESYGPAIDEARDRILFQGRDGDDWVIYAITLDGQQVELARLHIKIESPLGGIQPIDISQDGRLLAFSAVDWVNTGYGDTLAPVSRTGVIDLRTLEITWACEIDCAKVRLR